MRRYEWPRPGDLIHLDIKELGRFAKPGHRATGTRVGTHRSDGIGWEFVHVCIDDHSRLAYAEVLPDERKSSAMAFLSRATAWLQEHGVRVQRVMTDNGSCYRAREFRQLVAAGGLKHIYTRPYTPRTNGKAERFIQTLMREWAYGRIYASSDARTSYLKCWLDYYIASGYTEESATGRPSPGSPRLTGTTCLVSTPSPPGWDAGSASTSARRRGTPAPGVCDSSELVVPALQFRVAIRVDLDAAVVA